MDSITEDDQTLPIDFDQTSNFTQFLHHNKKLERQDSMQSDLTLSETNNPSVKEINYEAKKEKKRRSYSTTDQPPERPLSRGGTMREQDNVISELKKECFGLKMRIYYMEERLHDTFDASTEDIIKKNIELKVMIEELKQETRDKSDLLSKASLAMEQMSYEKENDIRQLRNEYSGEFNETQAKYEEKINKRNKEITYLKNEIETLNKKLQAEPKDLVDGPLQDKINTMENDMLVRDKEFKELHELLQKKDSDMEMLTKKFKEEEKILNSKIQDLEKTVANKESNLEMLRKDVERLAGSPERNNQHYKKLYERQGEELTEKENTVHDLKADLANKTHLAETLKEQVSNLEKTNKNLRSSLHDKEMETQRSVGKLQDQIKKLETCMAEKNAELEAKEQAFTKLKQNNLQANQQRVQFELDSLKDKDGQIVELSVQLKQQSYDVEKLKLLLDEKDKDVVFFGNSKLKAETELEKCREAFTEQLKKLKEANEEKENSKQKKITDLQELCHQLQENLQKQVNHKDKVIKYLAGAISEKDNMIQNLVDLSNDDVFEEKNPLIEKLQQKIREKDKLFDKTVEDHYAAIQAKDDDISKLRRDVREKENALEQIEVKCAALQEQLKIVQTSEGDAKQLIENLKDLLEKSSKHERELESRSCETLQEKDSAISRLSSLLNMKGQEIENLTSYLTDTLKQSDSQSHSPDRMKEIQEKVYNDASSTEVLSKLQENMITVSNRKHQELLSLLKDKEQVITDLRKMVTAAHDEKNEVLKELNLQLISAEQELKSVNKALLRLKNSQELEADMYQETLNEKDSIIEALVKNGQEKDRVISELKDRQDIPRSPSPSKMAELTKLRQAVDMLKEDSTKKDNQLQELLQKNGALKEKLSRRNTIDVSKKDEKIDKMEKDIQQQNNIVKSLEDEKGGSKQELLVQELEELIQATEKEKEKYKDFTKKLKNNQDPDSRRKLLENELSEVEHLRKNLQQLLLSLVKRNAISQNKDGAMKLKEENLKLQNKLRDLEKLNNSLTSGISFDKQSAQVIKDLKRRFNKSEDEKKSLQDDLKRCEVEARQLNEDLTAMKLEYEQLVHDRDHEISTITTRLNQLKDGNENLIQERDKCRDELIDCHRELDLVKLQLQEKSQVEKSMLQKNETIKKLEHDLKKKDNDVRNKQQLIETLQKENMEIRFKLNQAEQDLGQLNVNLEKMMHDMSKADADIATLETQLNENVGNMSDEKKLLKKDMKELCNINERLRNKVKDVTKAYEKVKTERELEKNDLFEELQKAKKTIRGLEEDILNRQRKNSKLEEEVELLQEKTEGYSALSQKLHNVEKENDELQRRIEEYVEAEETHNKMVLPELERLRSDIKVLTNEKNNLRSKQEKQLEKYAANKKVQEENTLLKEEITKLQTHLDSLNVEMKSSCNNVHKLKNELLDLKESKKQLESLLKDLQHAESDAKQKLSITKEENMEKEKRIALLTFQIEKLEKRLESVSPIHTSSQQNIALSSDAFTQTIPEKPTQMDDNSLIAMHIKEMRELRKQLEETIRNNDALRHQLEERLSQIEHDATMINDPELRVSLIRDNDAMRIKLNEHTAAQKRMKQHIDELMTEKNNDKDTINSLHVQIHELNELATNLKTEMEAYDRLVRQLGIDKKIRNATPGSKGLEGDDSKLDKNLLKALLDEIRYLRTQLKQSMDVNNALRQKLEQELGRPVSLSPLLTPQVQSLSTKRSLFSTALKNSIDSTGTEEDKENNRMSHNHVSPYETPTKDYDTFSQRSDCKMKPAADRCCLCGKLTDYSAMKRTSLRSIDLIASIHKKLLSCCRKKDFSKMDSVLKEISQAYKLVKEFSKLLKTFVTHEDSDHYLLAENVRLKDDVNRLKAMLTSKERFIKSTLDMFDDHALSKDNFEESITKQLIRARDTLKATKGNLQLKASQSQANSSAESASLLQINGLHENVDDEI
ncbi:myomegalin-like isoform X2 [Hydractinia symbiolongicarpus]|uniref:myomegalin-like isoform X2 n=1 Tax=Hydractinia symbiolongicarpus TaxID=13093 RepID=UPI00254A1132|nr:myomegalin-like isoform X2 [Hydractinia symbiolongicarpus]